MKREYWWIVLINLAGITGPIRCSKKSANSCWDISGELECTMVEGVVSISGQSATQFQSKDKREAELFALGARELAKRLTLYLS